MVAFSKADRLGSSPDGTLTRRQQHPQGFTLTTTPRLGEVLPGEGLTGGAHGVELIALGAVPERRPAGPVDLGYPFATLEQEGCKTGSIAAGTLDRPDPPSGSVPGGEAQQLAGTEGIGGNRDDLV